MIFFQKTIINLQEKTSRINGRSFLMKPYFSIIIPTYNRGYILWKTIQSIQNQTFSDWELIIIDDSSTDNTNLVVAQFLQDKRIYYFKNKKNLGPSQSRNIGLDKAKGEIIAYVDSDDPIFEFFLEYTKQMYDKNPKAVFSLSNHNRRRELYDDKFRLLDFNKAVTAHKGEITMKDVYHRNVHTSATSVAHKKIIKSKKLRWDPNFNMFEDIDFVMQISKVFPKGFIQIPTVLFNYSEKYGTNSLCSQTSYEDWANSYEALYQKHKKDPLMNGQTWYPSKVEKYRKLQKDLIKGKVPQPMYRYFPNYQAS